MPEHAVAKSGQAHATLPFFAAALGITFVLQAAAVLAWLGVIGGPVERYMPLVGLGAFGPSIAAVLAARLERGGPGVRALLRPLGTWRVGAGWYVVALGMPGAIFVAGMAMHAMLGGHDAGPWFYPPAGAERLAAMLVFPIGEEIGWRGFALPRLQARYGPIRASLILGTWWFAWHIPMLLLAGLSIAAMGVLLPFMVFGSLAFTWLYNRTRGSLIIAMLMHMGAHLNNSHQALPGNVTPVVIHTVAYGVLALALVLVDRKPWRAA